MSHKRHEELVESENSPKALVVGEGIIPRLLVRSLVERGCVTTQELKYFPSLSKYDYIFQFGDFKNVHVGLQNHLLLTGKILFIEATEEELTRIEKVKILRIGDPYAWNHTKLIEKILKVMFTQTSSDVVDARIKRKINYTSLTNMIIKPAHNETINATGFHKINSRLPVQTQNHRSQMFVEKHEINGLKSPINDEHLGKVILVKKNHFLTKKKLSFFLLLIILPLILFTLFVYMYIKSLNSTFSQFRAHLASSDFIAVSDDLKEAKKKIQLGGTVFDKATTIIFPLRGLEFAQNIDKLFSSSEKLIDSTIDLINFLKSSSLTKTSFITGSDQISKEDVEILKKKIAYFKSTIISSKEEISGIDSPFFPKENFNTLLVLATDKILSIEDMLPLFENILFSPTPKTYLILFQNNMELRPTGGFIGSYALVTINKGKIYDFKIQDVYTADGQLKGHVDPPEAIRKYLEQPHYFLRDSNFDPDFAKSGLLATWFLEKELGVKSDGVIAINSSLAQKFLKVIGSIQMADFGNEEINESNFFYKTLYFTQENFFPGSTKKKDFLTSLANEMMFKLTTEKKGFLWFQILPIVKQGLDEKNILIFSKDNEMQKMIENLGFAGRIVETKCVANKSSTEVVDTLNENNCFADYLSIIETNLGVNKANYFVSKSITVNKRITNKGEIVNQITINYENSGTREVAFGAIYTNYLRIFTPKDASLVSVTLNNTPLLPAQIDTNTYEGDKNVFGFLLKVAPENKAILKIDYILSGKNITNTDYYQFFFQKQSGDKSAPLVLQLTVPEAYKLKPLNFKSSSNNVLSILYSTDTSVDRIFAFSKE